MLHPRIIPCLLIHNKGLVKTTNFKDPKYVGDPINAVKIFNEKEVDEIIIVDIDATRKGAEPDYRLIEKLAYECRMPLCFGGGIKTPEQAQRIFGLGVEKISISSIALERPEIVGEIAEQVGNQSVVVVLDVKKKLFGGYEIYTHNGSQKKSVNLLEFVQTLERLGAGEIVINSIDNDGMMKGFDLKLIELIRDKISLPLTIMGGAGDIQDVGKVINEHGIIGVAAGSIFVFKGKYRAVLINYPTSMEKLDLMNQYFYPKWRTLKK